MFFEFPINQVILVIPVSQVIPVSPVNPVSPVSQVSPVSPVMLAHLWVDFRVILFPLSIRKEKKRSEKSNPRCPFDRKGASLTPHIENPMDVGRFGFAYLHILQILHVLHILHILHG